ncbi:MAG: arginine N-succinyltransferase, partial [Gammaproteobacteria bacterium]
GMELRLTGGRPSAVFKGISVWGVPLPDAWLGNMRNIDLVQQFGTAGGFWQAINDGVELIEVRDGRLLIKLKE